MGRIGRRNRSPLWPRGVTRWGGLACQRVKVGNGENLKGLTEERDGRACFVHTDSYGISPSDSQTDTFLSLFVFLSSSSFYF